VILRTRASADSSLGWGSGSDNYFTEICSGSEAGSYLRLIDFVHHSTLGLRVINKKKKFGGWGSGLEVEGSGGSAVFAREVARHWEEVRVQGSGFRV